MTLNSIRKQKNNIEHHEAISKHYVKRKINIIKLSHDVPFLVADHHQEKGRPAEPFLVAAFPKILEAGSFCMGGPTGGYRQKIKPDMETS